jgi:small-conductance mechanosensitive channel
MASSTAGLLLASEPVLFVLADISATELRDTCGRDPDAICREILQRTSNRTLAEVSDFIVGTPLTIVLIALGALLVNAFVGRVIERALRSLSNGIVRERLVAVKRRAPGTLMENATATSLRAEQRISALTSIVRSVAGFVILLLATFMVLSQVGVDVAPLLAGAGVVGVALGFGSQSLVKDFLSGIFILAEDQFGVGDVVDLDGQVSGAVEAVSLRTTRLRAADGTVWHIPNGAIVRVGNKSQHWARALLDVEVAGDTDVDHAEHVIKRVVQDLYHERDDILEEPEVRGIERRDDGPLVFRLLVKTLPADRAVVGPELRRRLADAFASEGIQRVGEEVWSAAEAGDAEAAADAAEAAVAAEAGDPEPPAEAGKPEVVAEAGQPEARAAAGKPEVVAEAGQPEARATAGKPEAAQQPKPPRPR